MRTLIAPLVALAVAAPAVARDDSDSKSIRQCIAETANLQTLYSAIEAADLGEALEGDGPFTIFAPTDAAFAKLPKEMIDNLLEPEYNEKLQRLVKFHVVPAKLEASAVSESDGEPIKTLLEGCTLPLSAQGETVKVGTATITKTDIHCANGVIHLIDAVQMPEEK